MCHLRKSFYFVLITIAFLHYNMYIQNVGMAELADASDLGSDVNSCRFNSCYPHHWVSTASSSHASGECANVKAWGHVQPDEVLKKVRIQWLQCGEPQSIHTEIYIGD